MKITVIIPSCSSSRISLLIQTVKSIQRGSYKDVQIIVVADGNPEIKDSFIGTKINEGQIKVMGILNEKRMDWVFSTNRVLKEFSSKYYIYASDDLVFPTDCINTAMMIMKRHFPNGDGIVSIGRKGRCIFGLFGNKFVSRFPKREVFCPDFIHFGADSELFRTVKELGKITYLPEEFRVKHFRRKDKTWRLARKIRSRDREVFYKRQEGSYKWGIDFKLVTRK